LSETTENQKQYFYSLFILIAKINIKKTTLGFWGFGADGCDQVEAIEEFPA